MKSSYFHEADLGDNQRTGGLADRQLLRITYHMAISRYVSEGLLTTLFPHSGANPVCRNTFLSNEPGSAHSERQGSKACQLPIRS